MTKIKYIFFAIGFFIMFILILVFNHHIAVDCIERFELSGQINDIYGKGIENANIYFTDISISPNQNERMIEKYIGKTNKDGKISTTYNYWWGFSYRIIKPKTLGDFELKVEKDNFKQKTLIYNINSIPAANGNYYIKFNITLKPSK